MNADAREYHIQRVVPMEVFDRGPEKIEGIIREELLQELFVKIAHFAISEHGANIKISFHSRSDGTPYPHKVFEARADISMPIAQIISHYDDHYFMDFHPRSKVGKFVVRIIKKLEGK